MKPLHAFAFFACGTATLMLLYGNELLLFGLLAGMSLFALSLDGWKETKRFLLAMLIGGLCENIAVMCGAWRYADANFMFAPLWLPVGWGMAVVLIDSMAGDGERDGNAGFSKRALVMSLAGTLMVGAMFRQELLVLLGFAIVTIALFLSGYYKKSELRAGIYAAALGTTMEALCIMAGNWHYSVSMLRIGDFAGVPLWLPLCWFNAFLIMRRIAK